MLLLLSSLAFAEDLTLVLALNDQRWTTTWADVRPGPLPSVVLRDGAREVRVDLSLVELAGSVVTLEFAARDVTKRRARTLWQGRIETRDPKSAAVFAVQDPNGAFQVIAASTTPEPLPDGTEDTRAITSGPYAGCEVTHRAGATIVACPDSMVFHRSFPLADEAARAELAAGMREMVGEHLVEERADTLPVGGRAWPAQRLVTSGAERPGLVLTVWIDRANATDQVSALCGAEVEQVCRARLEPFAAGLPTDLR